MVCDQNGSPRKRDNEYEHDAKQSEYSVAAIHVKLLIRILNGRTNCDLSGWLEADG